MTDLEESELGTNPTNSDSDSDGTSDGDEQTAGTDPLVADLVEADKESGSSCSSSGDTGQQLWFLALLSLVGFRRRTRS